MSSQAKHASLGSTFRRVYRSVWNKDVDLSVWEDVATREGEGLISRIDRVWFCNQQKYLWTVWRNFLSKAFVELHNLKEGNLSYCLISSRLTYYDCISGVTDFLKDRANNCFGHNRYVVRYNFRTRSKVITTFKNSETAHQTLNIHDIQHSTYTECTCSPVFD